MKFYDDPLDHDDLQPAEPADSTDPTDPAPGAGSRRSRRTLVALLLPFLLGAWMMWDGTRTPHPPTPVAAQAAPSAGHAPVSTSLAPIRPPAPVLLPLAWSPPTRITIPAIGLAAPVTPLGLDRTGELSAPNAKYTGVAKNAGTAKNAGMAGWYQDGVAPGQPGNALMVIPQLSSLHPGDRIEVLRQDGHTAAFSVDAVGPYAKNAGSGGSSSSATVPELRLVTPPASGISAGSDIVVDAHLVSVR
ncbi:class F sortase [Streptacidiphilus fuscans]|uniref:Class F sortase n=1 Tax=Streptacidiphilus fuscans TaxID=2789292 RepID=A0A931FCS0_9ACTN|nr:class F sortase [Streptacidiphilus fuscans]MBF9068763.1 class F sortase [Streptacidiphilus fuscans]